MYEIIYDYASEYDEAHNIREVFIGTWQEVVDYVASMKANGCYNIAVNDMYPEKEDEE